MYHILYIMTTFVYYITRYKKNIVKNFLGNCCGGVRYIEVEGYYPISILEVEKENAFSFAGSPKF